MTKIPPKSKNEQHTLKPKKLPKIPRNLKNYQNSLETYKMNEIILEPLICRKYP